MASELDTRTMDRRPPAATLISTFRHGDARDLCGDPLNGVLKNSPTFADGAISIQNSGASVTSSTLIGVEYPIATKTTKDWQLISISFWIYPENEGNGGIYGKRPPVIMMYSSANSYASWSGHWTCTLQSAGKLWFVRRYSNNEKDWYVNGSAYTLNAWQHIAMTMDCTTNTTKFYKNGTLMTTTNFYVGVPGIINGGCEIRLGSQFFTATANDGFDGQLSKLMIWEGKILTQSEVTEIYSQGRT